MNSTTLRGVFPEPKPVHRRNFIKENVKQIKQMQGILQEAGVIQPKASKGDRFQNIPKFVRTIEANSNVSKTEQPNSLNSSHRNLTVDKLKLDTQNKPRKRSDKFTNEKFTHRAMQTEKTDDLTKLYETGVIKYPKVRKSSGKPTGRGDYEDLNNQVEDLTLEERQEKDYVRENMKNIKPKYYKPPYEPPKKPEYEVGVVPKYLRERKEEEQQIQQQNMDMEDCPPGYVLLPEEDRKITLRNLRQSYADRIQELNTMPVRSDTLRMRKRKMQIEEELKKIDGGIKIFQRPKVYVKINE